MSQSYHVTTLKDELAQVLSRAVSSGKFEPPQLPHVAVKVMNLARRPDADLRQIGAVLSKDPVLAARVMQIANSAQFAAGAPARDLARAMVRIGLSGLKDLVYMYAFRGSVFKGREFKQEFNQLWMHAVATAIASDRIARRQKREIHQPFLAGLLHDLGQAVGLHIAVQMRKRNATIRAADPKRIYEAVDKMHAQLGALIAGKWELPEEVRETMRYHHDALHYRGKHRNLVLTVSAADYLTRSVGLGYGRSEAFPQKALETFKALGFNRSEIEDLGRETCEMANKLAEQF